MFPKVHLQLEEAPRSRQLAVARGFQKSQLEEVSKSQLAIGRCFQSSILLATRAERSSYGKTYFSVVLVQRQFRHKCVSLVILKRWCSKIQRLTMEEKCIFLRIRVGPKRISRSQVAVQGSCLQKSTPSHVTVWKRCTSFCSLSWGEKSGAE